MRFTVQIESANSAFAYENADSAAGVADILHTIAAKVRNHTADSGPVYDVNGNSVGSWSFVDNDDHNDGHCNVCGAMATLGNDYCSACGANQSVPDETLASFDRGPAPVTVGLTIPTDRGPVLTMTIGEVDASVWVDRWDAENPGIHGRWQFGYRISIDMSEDAHVIEGTDLRSGTVPQDTAPDLPDAMRSLLSFAGSAAEYGRPDQQQRDGDDNPCGWRRSHCEALYMVSDELGMLALELGGDD